MIARVEHKEEAKQIMAQGKRTMIGANVVSTLLQSGSLAVGSVATALASFVGIVLVFLLILGASNIDSLFSSLTLVLNNAGLVMLAGILLIISAVVVFYALVNIFSGAFSAPADCGNRRFYMAIAQNPSARPAVLTVLDGFHDFTGTFCTYMLLYAVLFAWTLPCLAAGFLFGLINGAVGLILRVIFYLGAAICWWVAYHLYWAVPYLKAEQPKKSAMSCLSEGRNLSRGHETDLMILSISFLGWEVLNIITLGLVGVFYYAPYSRMTCALVYNELRKGRLSLDGSISTAPAAPSPAPVPEPKQPKAGHETLKERVGGITGLTGEYGGVTFDIKEGQILTIGRDAQRCNLVLKNVPKVSGKHCEIRFVGDLYMVTDYSSNGTIVDGRRLPKEVPVSFPSGAKICLADEEVSFILR